MDHDKRDGTCIRGVCPRGLIEGDMRTSNYLGKTIASAGSAPAASLKGFYTAVLVLLFAASAGSAPAASLKEDVGHPFLERLPSHPRGLPPRPH